MPSDERRSFTLTVGEIIATAGWLDQIATRNRLPSETVFALQLCAEEILTNTLQHGGGPDIQVEVGVTVSSNHVELTVSDNGTHFDVTKASPRKVEGELESLQPGGLGILLLQQFASTLKYGAGPLGNDLRVTFELARPSAGGVTGE